MAIINHVYGPFLFFYIFLLLFPLTSTSVESDALLRLKSSFTNATALHSWTPGSEPCEGKHHWAGIKCENGVVSGLRLRNLGISGSIDVEALAALSGLRSFAVMSNGFSGPIPDFTRLRALKALYVTHNQFTGEIPSDYFANIAGLRKVWLSGNNFTGLIPYSLMNLAHLMELHLEQNQFTGEVPAFSQASLHSLNVSFNNLEGEIPASLSRIQEHSFVGNEGLCGEIVGKQCAQVLNAESFMDRHHTPENAFEIAMWVLFASFVVLLMMIAAIYTMRRKQERFHEMVEDNLDTSLSFSLSGREELSTRKGFGSSRKGSGLKSSQKGVGDLVMINYENGEFGMAHLMKAAAEVLGNGALGSSYKAAMANGLTVVVKRMKEMTKIGKDQFDAEMQRLGRLEHKNVLTPLAYHYRKEEKLMVYEYQPKGSLLLILHGDRDLSRAELTWPVRLKIIVGVARGLGYLHAQLSSLDLPHGDLKSSNVLLTANFEPLLTDYGYCYLISSNRAAHSLMAYKSPEAALDQSISPKCDVYCLGIIILEILTGKFPSQYATSSKGGTDLVQWAKTAIVEGKEADLFDPDIINDGSSLNEMVQLLHVGAACTESNPDKRLDIREAIGRLEDIYGDGSCVMDLKSIHIHTPLEGGYQEQPLAPFQAPVDSEGRRRDGIEEHSRNKSVTFDLC